MAKRKRLSPAAALGAPSIPAAAPPASPVRMRPPIADVSGEASAMAAFDEVSGALESAKREGRMALKLSLADVQSSHLVRDRVRVDEDEMESLKTSLAARGQQTPIEVVELSSGGYGLISGWRRLMALRTLFEQTGEARFAHVLALVRTPQSAADAYQAMVEENEIRADLSFYERARIAVKAVEQGVHDSVKSAVQSLFSAARAPKRSKILSFTALVAALDEHLRFPTAIPEKLGLALVSAMQADAQFHPRLIAALKAENPQDIAAERAVLETCLKQAAPPERSKTEKPKAEKSKKTSEPVALSEALTLSAQAGKVTLSGAGVDARLIKELRDFLEMRIKYHAARAKETESHSET